MVSARRAVALVAASLCACSLAASCAGDDAGPSAVEAGDASMDDATQDAGASLQADATGAADTQGAADASTDAPDDAPDAADAAVDTFVPWPALDAASCNCIDAAPKCCGVGLCVSTSSPQYGCGSDLCNACPDYANAEATCAASACAPKCDFGYGNCDGNDDNGCEAVLATDVDHCKACNAPCTARPNATMKCQNGCAIESCADPFDNCNANITDGCEIDTSTNASHCGACNNKCRAGLICYQKSCGGVNQASLVTIASGYELERVTNLSTDISVCQLALDGSDLYFSARTGIYKVSINGGAVTAIDASAGGLYLNGIAVDGTHVYYGRIETATGNSSIRRIPKAGGASTTMVTSGGSECFAVDATNLYWTNSLGAFVTPKTSTNVAFSNAPPMKLADGAANNAVAYGIAVDATTVYFTSTNVYSVPIGGGTRQLLASPFGGARGIALDANNLYFTTLGGARQLAKGADAGSMISLYAEGYYGIAVDTTHAYFDSYYKDLMRVPIGGGSVVSLTTNQASARSVVLNATHVFYTAGTSIYRVAK